MYGCSLFPFLPHLQTRNHSYSERVGELGRDTCAWNRGFWLEWDDGGIQSVVRGNVCICSLVVERTTGRKGLPVDWTSGVAVVLR